MNIGMEIVATAITVVLTVVGNLVALVRIYSRMEARMDVFEVRSANESGGVKEQIALLHTELARMRDQKHDHTGTVMRHEGSLKDQERRLNRLEQFCFHRHRDDEDDEKS